MIDPAARRLALARETANKLDSSLGLIHDQATDIIAAALDQYGDALARAIREEDAALAHQMAEAERGKPMDYWSGKMADFGDSIATAIRALRGASRTEGE